MDVANVGNKENSIFEFRSVSVNSKEKIFKFAFEIMAKARKKRLLRFST